MGCAPQAIVVVLEEEWEEVVIVVSMNGMCLCSEHHMSFETQHPTDTNTQSKTTHRYAPAKNRQVINSPTVIGCHSCGEFCNDVPGCTSCPDGHILYGAFPAGVVRFLTWIQSNIWKFLLLASGTFRRIHFPAVLQLVVECFACCRMSRFGIKLWIQRGLSCTIRNCNAICAICAHALFEFVKQPMPMPW